MEADIGGSTLAYTRPTVNRAQGSLPHTSHAFQRWVGAGAQPGSTPTTLTNVTTRDVDTAIRAVREKGRTVVLPFSKRMIRATRYAATDDRIPKPLRVSAAIGLLPVPVVTDVVLLIAAVPLGLFYREPLVDAWRRSGSR